MSHESAALSNELECESVEAFYFPQQLVESITSDPARAAMRAARDLVREGNSFSSLYIKTEPQRRLPYALRPLVLTDAEAAELDRVRKRPSPIDRRRLRGIPNS